MLGKLLQTLKSQKSSKPSQHQLPTSTSKQSISNKLAPSLQHYALPSNLTGLLLQHPQTSIPKIQYFTLPELPPLTATILSCPISVFHHLPYGNRKVKQIDLTKHPFPYYLQFMKPLLKLQLTDYNHLLINYYPPGVGIMPHSDGPAYYGKVIVLSLSSYCVINFQDGYMSGQESQVKRQIQQILQKEGKVLNREQTKNNKGKSSCARLLLQPNSIHIFQEQAYSKYLHGIQNYKIDTILISYCQDEKKVANCNISNYHILKVKQKIEEMIEKCNYDKSECGQVREGPIRVAKVEGNEQYTHVVQIERYERISITIRHKFQN